MKKLLTILMAVLLAVTLIACTDAPANDEVVNDDVVNDDAATPEVPEEDASDDLGEELPEEDDVVIELPEADAGDEPAMGTEEENVPAVMPEVDPEVDVPAVMPEVDVEVDVEAEDTPVVTPEVEAPEADAPASDATIDDLYAIADKLYEGIDPENMPMVGTMELDSESFEYSAFVPYKDSYLAVESMPMMGSQPHSVVIVKAASEAEAAALAAEMEANANPRKWICVSARSVKSASKGEFAILVMTSVEVMPMNGIDEEQAETMSAAQSEERADLIIKNFLSAVK